MRYLLSMGLLNLSISSNIMTFLLSANVQAIFLESNGCSNCLKSIDHDSLLCGGPLLAYCGGSIAVNL